MAKVPVLLGISLGKWETPGSASSHSKSVGMIREKGKHVGPEIGFENKMRRKSI